MLRQSYFLFAANGLGYGLRLLLPVFLVRILTKADVGIYNQFFLLEILIMMVFQMGVNQSLYFFIPRDEKNAGSYFLNSILLNIVLYAFAYTAVFLFRRQIADFLGMQVILLHFWQLACYTVTMMLNVCIESFLIARKKVLASSIFILARQVVATIATLGTAYVTRDVGAILLALVISRVLTLVCGLGYVHFRLHGFRAQRYFFDIGPQIRYGILLGLAGTIWTILMRLNEFTVSRYYSIETYAIYSQGVKQIPILMYFSQSILTVALVEFARLEKEGDWQGIRSLWEKILGQLYGMGIPVTLVLVLAAPVLVPLMFTSEYAAAIPIFQLNNIALLSLIINPTPIMRAMDRNGVTVAIHLVLLLVMPLALYLGMKMNGLIGIMIVHAVVLIGGRLLSLGVLNRLAPVRLAFFPPIQLVLRFYRDLFYIGRDRIRAIVSPRHGKGS